MTAQTISTVMFSWNGSAWRPADLRCLMMAQVIAPNTTMKIKTMAHVIKA